ncbi:MAG: hypothetical protein SVZ03_06050 [Spirochaetota bacterium]|nr:hypothetical protein [Spirochaetota bacterium]
MDIVDTKNAELLKKGNLLIVQGQNPEYLHYIHSGILEILSTPPEYEGLDPDIIISKSRRVGIIKEKTLISYLSVPFKGPYKKSIRVLEDSQISKHPIKNRKLSDIAREDPSLSLNIVIHLLKRLEASIADTHSYAKLYQNLCKIDDNFSLMFKTLSKTNTSDKLQEKSEILYKAFLNNQGSLPSEFDAKFLIADNSNQLKKKYSFPGLPIESLVDTKQCKFIQKFLKLRVKTFASIINEDSSICEDMIDILSDNIIKILDRIESIQKEIDKEMTNLFGSDLSWSSYLVNEGGINEWFRSGRLSIDFTKNLISILAKIITYYKTLFGENPTLKYPGFNAINKFHQSMKSKIENKSVKQGKITGNSIRDYHNSLHQIFEFALIDKEFQGNFLKTLTNFKSMKNPFNTESDGRKSRRHISNLYWDLFKQVYIRNQNESVSPPSVRMMMRFGFIDETLLEENQILELDELMSKREEKTNTPILFEDEFLTKIYNGEENASITEMGLSYEAFLREEEKHKKKSKKGSNIEVEDENIKKAMYEIDHRLFTTVAVCSGSTATAFPILTSMTIKGNPSKYYTSKEKIESVIKKLMDVDFSVFYRETVVKLDEAREIIQEEVIPNIILLPSFGTKTMLWQELDGKNRKTKGRIVVPILFSGDLTKSMAHTLACFRWELNRTIKGGMWADPVEGGITGAYFDYVNFYKKNSKLSAETKDKISERFKSLRTNRDRFADDYIMWVLFEKDGVMRLNSVIRDMFYKHIPFKKELRSKLENMPAFTEIASRYNNLLERRINNYQRKYKKYMDTNSILPDSLQRYMDFISN